MEPICPRCGSALNPREGLRRRLCPRCDATPEITSPRHDPETWRKHWDKANKPQRRHKQIII